MKYVWVCLLGSVVFFALFLAVFSYRNFVHVETASQHEVILFDNPEERTLRYGELTGYPHMYEFSTRKEMILSLSVAVPDREEVQNIMSGIILSVQKDGSVVEVARLRAREASWESFYEPLGGDIYRRGGSFSASIQPGLYRVEVSTPDNIGPYALFSGTEPVSERMGYIASLQAVYALKVALGKSGFSLIGSPLVYVPVMLAVLVFCTLWYVRSREQNENV